MIKKGSECLPDSTHKIALRAWLADELLVRFQSQILLVDLAVMLTWGQLPMTLEQKGRKLPVMDSLVATIAVQGQFVLVMRIEADFADTEVTVLNLWP